MSNHDSQEHRSWWKLVLTGFLAIVFGIAGAVLPAGILSVRILEALFGVAKPFSGAVTAIAALLALVAVVAIDGLVNLFGTGVMGQRTSRIRGFIGVAVTITAIFWPDQTVLVAVELIGIWAILIGILELFFASYSREDAKQRVLLMIAAVASIAIGIGVMKRPFVGAVLVSAMVGIAAAARGITLIMAGMSHRHYEQNGSKKQTLRRDAA